MLIESKFYCITSLIMWKKTLKQSSNLQIASRTYIRIHTLLQILKKESKQFSIYKGGQQPSEMQVPKFKLNSVFLTINLPMATSTLFSLSCTPQSRLLSKQKSHTMSPTMSLLSPQVGQKHLYHPLRHNGFSPIHMNPKRVNVGGSVSVKASMNNKNVEVFTKEHLAVSLAKYVADLSRKFIQDRGCFTIVLSSGSVKYLR